MMRHFKPSPSLERSHQIDKRLVDLGLARAPPFSEPSIASGPSPLLRPPPSSRAPSFTSKDSREVTERTQPLFGQSLGHKLAKTLQEFTAEYIEQRLQHLELKGENRDFQNAAGYLSRPPQYPPLCLPQCPPQISPQFPPQYLLQRPPECSPQRPPQSPPQCLPQCPPPRPSPCPPQYLPPSSPQYLTHSPPQQKPLLISEKGESVDVSSHPTETDFCIQNHHQMEQVNLRLQRVGLFPLKECEEHQMTQQDVSQQSQPQVLKYNHMLSMHEVVSSGVRKARGSPQSGRSLQSGGPAQSSSKNFKDTQKLSQFSETAPRNDTRNGSNGVLLQNLQPIGSQQSVSLAHSSKRLGEAGQMPTKSSVTFLDTSQLDVEAIKMLDQRRELRKRGQAFMSRFMTEYRVINV